MRIQLTKGSMKLYDVAAGPMYLIIFGIPLAIILGVVGLVFLAGKLIEKARARNQQTLDAPADRAEPPVPDQKDKES